MSHFELRFEGLFWTRYATSVRCFGALSSLELKLWCVEVEGLLHLKNLRLSCLKKYIFADFYYLFVKFGETFTCFTISFI